MVSRTLAAPTLRSEPERLAWRILVAAFAVFLTLCALLGYALWWFVFQSTVPLATEVAVAQGTASIIEPSLETPETDRRSGLSEGISIHTNDRTQAMVSFDDPATGQPVASVVVFQDSEIAIHSAQAPRFSLNQHPYEIEIEASTGIIEVLTLDTARRGVEVTVVSPHMRAQIQTSGLYQIDVSAGNTRVTAESGRARVTRKDGNASVVLGENRRTTVAESHRSLEVRQAPHRLLENSDFDAPLTEGWEPYNEVDPPGLLYNSTLDGRSVVVIDRSQSLYPGQLLSHDETGLRQHLNTDISGYNSVSFRVTFLIAEQSLAACGELASECPLMILVKFLDAAGTERLIRHGFYANHDPSRPWPLRCDTCFDWHERISLGSWYTYETNVFDILTGDQRPVTVTEVSFYASGHAYKTYVSEIQLLVEE